MRMPRRKSTDLWSFGERVESVPIRSRQLSVNENEGRVNRFLSMLAVVAVVLLLCIASPYARFEVRAAAAAQGSGQTNARLDPAMVTAGRGTFGPNCGFCHGIDARGGAEGGPDLTRSTIVTGDLTGQQLIKFLKVGRLPKMPAFNLSGSQVTEMMVFLHSQILATVNNRDLDPKIILVGDARSGEAYFNGPGQCTTCHSVTGDLKGIGSKYDAMALQGRMVLPRGHGRFRQSSQQYAPDVLRTVTVTQASGQSISGDLLTVSDYHVTLRDSSGTLHTFTRNGASPKVEIKDPLHAHLALLLKLTNKDMHDLTAYLVTLK
jgi:cytochrome c oxidase cbb3-type subunit 3